MTAPALDALIERCDGLAGDGSRAGSRTMREAAAALVQLREENARLQNCESEVVTMLREENARLGNDYNVAREAHDRRAQELARAEAEVARLQAQASAVVVIMPPREPTQEMDDAASNVDRRNLPGVFRRQVWRAMWDASGVAKASVITGNKP